jgi:glycolate oxidase FAD binding subunit
LTGSPESIFREHLGSAAVESGDAVYRYTAAGAVPACVLTPSTVDEVVIAVETAHRNGFALVPAGHGTHLDIGWPPRRYDAALSTRRLAAIAAHDAADMTVTAAAGVTLAALRAVLSAARQWLPLDPARGDEMTVGGLIAADRSGPLRFAHGKVRDWLLGVSVVTGEGARVRGGGRVVKNVAGYDLPKLLAGSFGTLGVIVEATFKVRPSPEAEAVFVWPAASFDEAMAAAMRVLGSPVLPVLLEAVNAVAAESLGLGEDAHVVLACAGAAAHVDEQDARVRALSAGRAERLDDERGRALRRALSDFSQPANDEAAVARLSALPAGAAGVLADVERAAGEGRIVAETAAHAGSGVAWCQFLGAPSAEALLETLERVRAIARRHGAWVVFEALPAELRARVDPWGFEAPAVRLMRGVKQAFDPAGVLSPGRFVGRL